jgi:S1-C subfamily serine protease
MIGPALVGVAQAPDVPVYRDGGEPGNVLTANAEKQRAAGTLLTPKDVRDQIQRTNTALALPAPGVQELSDTEVWRRARAAHVVVGWHYLCRKCDKWHQTLGGGYFISADGAVVTCHHVVRPNPNHREAYLIAADESGAVWPVAEILAASEINDSAIVRLRLTGTVQPLPLKTNTTPGDAAWCFSDPLGKRGYFSKGMVNRFFFESQPRGETIRMNVSTDWAPGSSGSAILDRFGNAIGHVAEISTGRPRSPGTNQNDSAVIVFHEAIRAADVLALTRRSPAVK